MSNSLEQSRELKESIKLLEEIGISGPEFSAYKKVFTDGPITVLNLSRALDTPRATIHQYTEKLIQSGLLFHTYEGKKRLLVAKDPKELSKITEKRKSEISTKISELNVIDQSIPIISNFLNSLTKKDVDQNLSRTKIEFHSGEQSIEAVYDDMIKSDIVYSYANAFWIEERIPNVPLKWKEALGNFEIKSYDLVLGMPENDYIEGFFAHLKNYNYKYLPFKKEWDGFDFSIYRDRIAIIQLKSEPEAVIIKDQNLSDFAKANFQLIWELLPETN